MRTTTLTIAAVALTAGLCAAQGQKAMSEDQKVLYSLGAAVAQNLGPFRLTPAEIPFVISGLNDQLQGKKLQADLDAYSPKIQELARSRQASAAEAEKKAGAAYAASAVKEKGAVKTSSGLVYIPMKPGKGASPKASDTVKVHYHGTLTDGTVFDSSVKRGTPAEFPLDRVIPCWTEGVQKMKVGGKAKLVCPSSIAYGDQGRPPVIPGGATLVFEVELLDIVQPPAAAK